MDPYRTRKIARIIAIIVAIVMILTSFSFVVMIPGLFGMEGSVVYAAETNDDLDLQMKNLKEYIEYIQQNYKDDVSLDQLVKGAYGGVVSSLGDPYSVYYASSDDAENFIEAVTGEYVGVGLNLESFNGQCRVVAPLVGTPAEKSGIKSGDIVKKVNGTDISSKSLDEAISLMRGEEGTTVTLVVNRDGKFLNFTLARAKIHNVSVAYKVMNNSVGYIQIASFDNDSNKEFAAALDALKKQGIKSLIIDIRNNPGGLVNTAMDIANQLMPAGPISYFEQKDKVMESFSADGKSDFKLPLVLLVNEGSASASEILAGALQDSKTAKLVGTTTFGKGVSQVMIGLNNGTNFKLSTEYFLTPDKHVINHIGITPDYTVQRPENPNAEQLAEKFMSFAPMSEKVKAKAGSIGLNVFGAQQRLSMIGYPVKATGTMDNATVDSVKKFQKENGLYACGILDFTTMTDLDRATVDFITGAKEDQDMQLQKAVDLLQ